MNELAVVGGTMAELPNSGNTGAAQRQAEPLCARTTQAGWQAGPLRDLGERPAESEIPLESGRGFQTG
jgi:hypothetical protein